MAAKSPTQRAIISSIGGLRRKALYDGRAVTAKSHQVARDNLNRRLLAEIDPDNKLSPGERAKRLEAARSAHFKQLALRRLQQADDGKAVRK